MTAPSKTWTRSRVPSTTRTWTLTVSPGANSGMSSRRLVASTMSVGFMTQAPAVGGGNRRASDRSGEPRQDRARPTIPNHAARAPPYRGSTPGRVAARRSRYSGNSANRSRSASSSPPRAVDQVGTTARGSPARPAPDANGRRGHGRPIAAPPAPPSRGTPAGRV